MKTTKTLASKVIFVCRTITTIHRVAAVGCSTFVLKGTMIRGIFVINNHGQPRVVKFYERLPESMQQQLLRDLFLLVSSRSDNVCNFLDGDALSGDWGTGTKLIYRHYATLYFIFACEETESELGILDLIQVFVETLDKCFENVCELDLIFHGDKVHYILDEIVMGGMVLETNMNHILHAVNETAKLEAATAQQK